MVGDEKEMWAMGANPFKPTAGKMPPILIGQQLVAR